MTTFLRALSVLKRLAEMVSELLRFRVARAPQRQCAIDPGRPPLRIASWLTTSSLLPALVGAPPGGRSAIAANHVTSWTNAALLDFGDLDDPFGRQLGRFDAWLVCRGSAPRLDEVGVELTRIFDRTVGSGSSTASGGVGSASDPLTALAQELAERLLVTAYVATAPATQQVVMRGVLVLGLVERLIYANPAMTRADEVRWSLRDRLVLLPRSLGVARSAVVRQPGFADLHVVRQEWNRYLPGEIAHIENVLPNEFRERRHLRIEETEITETSETEETLSTELDSQSTSRFELSEEASTDTASQTHVEGQVDTSGQYGPTHVETHLGGSLDFSREESEETASEHSSEVVSRAVTRVEKRVRHIRTQRTLSSIRERNIHRIDNGRKATVGMYRWVDKVVRLQRYRYLNRFLLEFEVPEPAAYHRYVLEHNQDNGMRNPRPEPFTIDGKEDGADLLPTHVSESALDAANQPNPYYYLTLAAKWAVKDVEPPPPLELTVSGWLHVKADDPSSDKTSVDVWVTPGDGGPSAGGADGQPLKIPDGYLAKQDPNPAVPDWRGWLSTWDRDDSVRPGWNSEKDDDDSYAHGDSWAYIPPVVFVTVGDSQADPNEDPQQTAWPEGYNLMSGARSAVSKKFGANLTVDVAAWCRSRY